MAPGLHDRTLVAACGFAWILALLDFGNHVFERSLHILVVSGAGLSPGALELFSESFAVFGCDLTLLGS
jgi:hypothetical protein